MKPENQVEPSNETNLPAKSNGGDALSPDISKGIELVVSAIAPITQPFAKAEQLKQTEETKRHAMTIGALRLSAILLFFVIIAIFILAGIALCLGKDSLTEKMIIAALSFLGGLGLGRLTVTGGKRGDE
jgi:uncharacterized membrane protein YgcG